MTEILNKEIKCKFCGGIAKMHTYEVYEDDEGNYSFEMFYIKCDNCGKSTNSEFLPKDAIEKWNNGELDNDGN